MQIDYIESSSNYDIAADVYLTLMHHKTDKGVDYIDIETVIAHLKFLYEYDQAPVAIAIRAANKEG